MSGVFGEVFPALVDEAIKRVDDLTCVYSSCIKLWFAQTGKLDVGFNNKEMVKWIRNNRPDLFDEKGKKRNDPNS
jgi:hypothetical protein